MCRRWPGGRHPLRCELWQQQWQCAVMHTETGYVRQSVTSPDPHPLPLISVVNQPLITASPHRPQTFRGPLTPEQKRMLEYEPPCSLPTSMWSTPVDLPWRVR